jgi:hypothetical protein
VIEFSLTGARIMALAEEAMHTDVDADFYAGVFST